MRRALRLDSMLHLNLLRTKFLRLWLLPAALPLLATITHAQQPPVPQDAPPAATPAANPQAMAEYRRRLRNYTHAWQSFDSEARSSKSGARG